MKALEAFITLKAINATVVEVKEEVAVTQEEAGAKEAEVVALRTMDAKTIGDTKVVEVPNEEKANEHWSFLSLSLFFFWFYMYG